MSSNIIATQVTREAWYFTLRHFSTFFKIAIGPVVLSILLNGVAAFSSINQSPLPHALLDGFGAIIEAFWGIRWLRFIMHTDKSHTPAFTFGKIEVLYVFYSFLLLIPFMVDDFLFIQGFRYDYTFFYALGLVGCLIIFLRFEFIFPALAHQDKTGFGISWAQSKKSWGNILKSDSQGLFIMIPVGCIVLLCLGLLILILWPLGFMNFENWILDRDGWHILLDRNPIIVWLYIIAKESLWSLMKALSMVIAATYYMLFREKSS